MHAPHDAHAQTSPRVKRSFLTDAAGCGGAEAAEGDGGAADGGGGAGGAGEGAAIGGRADCLGIKAHLPLVEHAVAISSKRVRRQLG